MASEIKFKKSAKPNTKIMCEKCGENYIIQDLWLGDFGDKLLRAEKPVNPLQKELYIKYTGKYAHNKTPTDIVKSPIYEHKISKIISDFYMQNTVYYFSFFPFVNAQKKIRYTFHLRDDFIVGYTSWTERGYKNSMVRCVGVGKNFFYVLSSVFEGKIQRGKITDETDFSDLGKLLLFSPLEEFLVFVI